MNRSETARRLRHWGGSSVRVEQLLVNALSRLPDDRCEAALDECVFVTIGRDDGGFSIPAAFVSKSWVVVLNEDWEDEDFESAVAHELAHLSPKRRPADLFLESKRTRTRRRHGCVSGASPA